MPENKKFWKFCNQAGNKVELLLYGDISQTSWWGDEVTPKQFAEELAGQKQAAAARRTLVLETKYGAKIYPLDELLHLYLTEGEHKTDILEHLKEEAL